MPQDNYELFFLLFVARAFKVVLNRTIELNATFGRPKDRHISLHMTIGFVSKVITVQYILDWIQAFRDILHQGSDAYGYNTQHTVAYKHNVIAHVFMHTGRGNLQPSHDHRRLKNCSKVGSARPLRPYKAL